MTRMYYDCPICGGFTNNHRPGCPAYNGKGAYAPKQTTKRCPYCKSVNPKSEKRCRYCGAPLEGE